MEKQEMRNEWLRLKNAEAAMAPEDRVKKEATKAAQV